MKEIIGIMAGGILVLAVVVAWLVPDPGHDEAGFALLLAALAVFALFYYHRRRS